MKTTVISYSLTGNNDAPAKNLAGALAAEHASITEPKRRTMGTIVLDNMLNRMPKVALPALKPEERDLVVFVGPVWMDKWQARCAPASKSSDPNSADTPSLPSAAARMGRIPSWRLN